MRKNPTKFFFFMYLTIGVLLLILSLSRHQKFDSTPIIFMALFFVSGLLLGLIASIVIRKPTKEPLNYLLGQLLPLLGFLTMIIYFGIRDANKPYSERNEETIKNTGQTLQLAYQKMKSCFPSPDDYLIHTYAVFSHDSADHFQIDTVHNVFLEYNLKGHPKITYYSKFMIYKDAVTVIEFQIKTDSSDEYKYVEKTRGTIDKTVDQLEKFRNQREKAEGTFK